jgi:putative phage-type endonuclease
MAESLFPHRLSECRTPHFQEKAMTAQPKFSAKQNTPEWLRERGKYMGSSDAPAALGMSRWRDPVEVAREKKKTRTGDVHPQPETDAQRRGHVLEPVVARLYELATDAVLSECDSVVHPDHPWMAASPDRAVVNDETDPAANILCEIKTHNIHTRRMYGEPGSEDITEYEYVQVQHQMAVTGCLRADLSVLFGDAQALQVLSDMVESGVDVETAARIAGQMEFCIFPIRRDDELIADLIEAEGEFWRRYVEGDEEPVDIKTIKPRTGIREGTAEEKRLSESLHDAWLQQHRGKEKFEHIKEALQDMIGEAEGIHTRVGAITWKKNKDTEKIVTDWQAVALALVEKHGTENDWLNALIEENTTTKTKRGPRVFRVPSVWENEL